MYITILEYYGATHSCTLLFTTYWNLEIVLTFDKCWVESCSGILTQESIFMIQTFSIKKIELWMRSIQFSYTANTLSAYLDPNMSHVRHPWSTHLLFSLQGSLLYVHIYSFKRLFTNQMLTRPLKQVHCVCYPTFMEQLLCQRCSDAIDFLEEQKKLY